MLYIDNNPLPGAGRSKLWRVFADGTIELRDALHRAGSSPHLHAPGKPGEHAVVTTAVKNKLKADEVPGRTIVKLIRRKNRGLPPPTKVEEIPEDGHASDCATPATPPDYWHDEHGWDEKG